jgi:hypothetical protein
MVHVGATTVVSIPKNNYSIYVIFMIVASCIRFPQFVQIAGQMKKHLAICTCSYPMYKYVLNWLRLDYLKC